MDERQRRAYHALRKIARKEGVPVEQVIRNIDEVIQETYFTVQRENNQKVLSLWHEIPCEGEVPTALELVVYLAEKVNHS